MIARGINGRGVDLTYRLDPKLVEVLGEYRLEMIDEVVFGAIVEQVQASYLAASTGAMRWPCSMRPEVLIDARGVML